jgi:xanthine dehydrogenase accessory factor
VNCRSGPPEPGSATSGGQRAVIEAARRLRAAGEAFALALVVEAQGSTYRKPGAIALVAASGPRVGVISGGCLEQALGDLAREALAAGAPRDAVFDTRSDDDLVFGSGSGCRGRMRVLALPVGPRQPCAPLESILAGHDSRRAVTLDLPALAPELFDHGQVSVRPPPALLLFGAGPETPPLLRIARALGWFAWLADHRDGLLVPDRVGEADRILRGRPTSALAEVAGEPIDAAVVMTHLAEHDLEALCALAGREVAYVGLLGPAARRDELLSRLAMEERAALAPRLHAPVGLSLGGEGPEAIALAIAADLQRAFNAVKSLRRDR